jgi:hypothetical protein
MYVAPLAALSYNQRPTDSEDAVTSHIASEALLRSVSPGFSADDFDAGSYLSPYSTTSPIVEDHMWRDALTPMMHLEFRAGSEIKSSDLNVQWFDDVAQAIDIGAISEAPLSLVDHLC